MIPCAYHPQEPSVAVCEKCDKPVCVVCRKQVRVGGGTSSQGHHQTPVVKSYCRMCAPRVERKGAVATIVIGAVFTLVSLVILSLFLKARGGALFKLFPLIFTGIGIFIIIKGVRTYNRNVGKEEEELRRIKELKSKPMEVTPEAEEKPTVVFQVEKYYAGGSIDVKDSVIQRSTLDVGAMEVPSRKFDDPKNREAYKDAVKGALSDGIISDSEEKILAALRKHFNIGEATADEIYQEVRKEITTITFRKKDTVNIFEMECPKCSESFRVEDSGNDVLAITCPSCGLEGEL